MPVEASGGVLWRPQDSVILVALVHRPKYDDWTLPKGKLLPDEHPLLGGLREVTEETGFVATPGRPLAESHYTKDGQPKRVRYWAMRAGAGSFEPTREVDRLEWVAPSDGLARLTVDRHVLEAFLADTVHTWPLLLLRHGSAGEPGEWEGPDQARPLDPLGSRQAAAWSALLDVYAVRRVLSADLERCLETVRPFAREHAVSIEIDPLLSESGCAASPDAAAGHLLAAARAVVPTVVCSQGKPIPALLSRLADALYWRPPSDAGLSKGGAWVAHLTGDPELRVVALEKFGPPVTSTAPAAAG